MRIVFTDHALLKMEQRNLSRRVVEEAVRFPDVVRLSHSERKEYYRRHGRLYLKVILKREYGATIILTAHWIARIPKF